MRVVGGELKGRTIRTCEGPGYRPATMKVRESVFSMLAARGVDFASARVIDLFAGSGSLGFEALSRGAAFACFVEKDAAAAGIIRDNARAFGLGPALARVVVRNVNTFLRQEPSSILGDENGFNVVFVDPPYGKDLLLPALKSVLDRSWLAPDGLLLAEVEAGLDLDPDAIDARLQTQADRAYGQTRIVVWSP